MNLGPIPTFILLFGLILVIYFFRPNHVNRLSTIITYAFLQPSFFQSLFRTFFKFCHHKSVGDPSRFFFPCVRASEALSVTLLHTHPSGTTGAILSAHAQIDQKSQLFTSSLFSAISADHDSRSHDRLKSRLFRLFFSCPR